MRTHRPTLALALALSIPAAALGQEAHWDAWRGAGQAGVAPQDARPPVTFGEDANLRWKVALPGLGASTPVVVGDRLYLTSAAPLDDEGWLGEDGQFAPPEAVPHALHVHAYQRSNGDPVWTRKLLNATPREKGHATGTLASGSIVTDGERLFAFFGSRGVFALDLEGKVLWDKDLGEQETLRGFGEGASPALAGGLVLVPWDHEGQSALVALDAETGEERWRQERDHDSSWCTPAVAAVGERHQVILSGSDSVHAYDLETGEPVWWCGGMSKNPTSSPVVADGVAYAMNSFRGKAILAVKLEGAEGDVSETDAVLWRHNQSASYVPCPVVHEGRFYFLRDSTGTLNCLDAATGEPLYYGERLADMRTVHASPLLADGKLYLASREGTVGVVKAGSEFELLATNHLEDVFDASPVALGEELYLRGRRHLYCFAKSD